MFSSRSMRGCAVACVAAAALAVGVAACGDSDDAGSDAASTRATTASTDAERTTDTETTARKPAKTKAGKSDDAPAAGSGDTARAYDGFVERPAPGDVSSPAEKEVTETVARVYEAFAAGDAKGICAGMSKAARKQIAEGGNPLAPGKEMTCEQSFDSFLAAARQSGSLKQTFRAKVGKAEIDGDVANVTVTLGGKSGQVRLVKEDGEWRFNAPGVGTTG